MLHKHIAVVIAHYRFWAGLANTIKPIFWQLAWGDCHVIGLKLLVLVNYIHHRYQPLAPLNGLTMFNHQHVGPQIHHLDQAAGWIFSHPGFNQLVADECMGWWHSSDEWRSSHENQRNDGMIGCSLLMKSWDDWLWKWSLNDNDNHSYQHWWNFVVKMIAYQPFSMTPALAGWGRQQQLRQ